MPGPEELKDSIIELSKKVGNGYLLEVDRGYLLEVDMSYPHDLHDLLNDLPFMCEKMTINEVQKLVPNLYHKKNYVIHIMALDQALRHGLILHKVHQAIEFNQTACLAPYIDFNTQLQTKAKNDFEKDFFKLMNISVFGKITENIRKHRDIKLVTNKKAYRKRLVKLSFKSGIRFSENLIGCEMGKTSVAMDKSIHLGQAILDLSKIIMYKFHSIADDIEARFYTSGYNTNRPLPIGVNKKVIGLMKE